MNEYIFIKEVLYNYRLLTAVSKSTKLKAVLREIVPEKNSGKKQQHLEIWKKSNLLSTLDLTALDVHGDVYCDSKFLRIDSAIINNLNFNYAFIT